MKFAASTVLTLWMTGMAATVHAEPITYLFVQTGATVPWLELHASIALADPAAGLPTLSCTLSAGQYSPPCPIDDFGNILALTFDRGASPASHFSLFDFHTSNPGPFPFAFLEWSISPTLIHFNNSLDEFFINRSRHRRAGLNQAQFRPWHLFNRCSAYGSLHRHGSMDSRP